MNPLDLARVYHINPTWENPTPLRLYPPVISVGNWVPVPDYYVVPVGDDRDSKGHRKHRNSLCVPPVPVGDDRDSKGHRKHRNSLCIPPVPVGEDRNSKGNRKNRKDHYNIDQDEVQLNLLETSSEDENFESEEERQFALQQHQYNCTMFFITPTSEELHKRVMIINGDESVEHRSALAPWLMIEKKGKLSLEDSIKFGFQKKFGSTKIFILK